MSIQEGKMLAYSCFYKITRYVGSDLQSWTGTYYIHSVEWFDWDQTRVSVWKYSTITLPCWFFLTKMIFLFFLLGRRCIIWNETRIIHKAHTNANKYSTTMCYTFSLWSVPVGGMSRFLGKLEYDPRCPAGVFRITPQNQIGISF